MAVSHTFWKECIDQSSVRIIAAFVEGGRTMAALVGFSGFVGTTLRTARPAQFVDLFNSKNFTEMVGCSFDDIVCAGIDARKWLANKEPVADLERIDALLDVLDRTEAGRLTLVSTVDVYGEPGEGPNENSDPRPGHAYGRNRLHAEQRLIDGVGRRFGEVRVVRLPALFGAGLKKNALFDLMHDNDVGKIDPRGTFQFYNMSSLADDIEASWREEGVVRNLVTPPCQMKDLVERLFPEQADRVGAEVAEGAIPARYDVRTRFHASGYICSNESLFECLEAFVRAKSGA